MLKSKSYTTFNLITQKGKTPMNTTAIDVLVYLLGSFLFIKKFKMDF